MADALSAHALACRPPIILSESEYDILVGLAAHGARRQPEAARLLLEEADRADLVPATRLPPDVAALGTEVVFTDEATGITRRVRIVMPVEADIGQGRISVLSLVGAGLIGLRAGQSIEWPTQDGTLRRLHLRSVEPA